MLIKKELENIPVLAFPITTQKERRNCTLSAAAQLYTLDRCGTVLVADIFDTKTKTLKLRFFCDGTTFLVSQSWPAAKWERKKPVNCLPFDGNAASLQKDDDVAFKFLKDGFTSWYYGHTLYSHINGFVSAIYSRKQEQAMYRKYKKRDEHFAMYPEYPADLPMYCEKHVFTHTYIFIEKVVKGERNAVCGHCQHKFKVKSADASPGKTGVCPICGMKAKYRGDWVDVPPVDKVRICVAHRADGNLILRWTEVQRTYVGSEYRYSFDDYYRNLYIRMAQKNVIYAYRYFNNMGWGWDWFRKKNGTVNYEKTYLYAGNLDDVFGNSYYHVDLQTGLMNAGPINFPALLDNLKNTCAAEYLFKMGLSVLAGNMRFENLHEGKGFSNMLGVSRQYLPLYREFNIDVYEHRVIKGSSTWVSAESFAKFRALQSEKGDVTDIIDILEQMSFEWFVNYFSKQKNLLRRKLKHILTLYKDYIGMAEALKADLSRKSVRFPKNIKEAHDLILPRFNEVKHEVENENFKQAVEKLYAGITEFKKGIFCIVFPQLRSDLIAEGQSLNHCVGSESYFKNHVEGTRMIFFVRKVIEPEKAFFTMEIDMRELKIRQLYGFGGCSPSAEVRQFANEFLRRLKPGA